ncbi:hypothetical protein H0N99_02840 [Candidatus Micrarchaeota archaeon]|nr:hypothetical protein [Candidatus Micrarchaeota archaeon]
MSYDKKVVCIAANIIPFLRKREPEPKPEPDEGTKECESELEVCRRRESIYRKIIERYRELIEAGESKSIPELRSLVRPQSSSVVELKEKLTREFKPYDYERVFLTVAQKAYEFVKDEIKTEHVNIEFWLSPKDILELKAADEMDKAILLCSLLIALGNKGAKVVVEMKGGLKHAFVMFSFGNRYYLFDPVHDINLAGSKEILEAQISTEKDEENKIVYEFNDTEYNEW